MTQALTYLCSTTGPQPWFVPVVVIVSSLGPGSVPPRETVLAFPGLQMPILRTCLHRHSLHWTQLLYPRSLRLLSPHPGDIRPGWDLGPLLRCLRDDVGGPRPPSGPGHQAQGSLRDLSLSRHLLLLMMVHRLRYHRPR